MNARGRTRKQHLLNSAGQREVEIELFFLDLEAQKIGVVQGQRRLFGERLNKREIRFAERQSVRRIRSEPSQLPS